MATNPDEPQNLDELNRQLKDALRQCDHLVDRARRLLRRSEQDNELPDAAD